MSRWMDDAACLNAPLAFFFADRPTKREEEDAEDKLAEWVVPMFCAICPIREQCLKVGLKEDSGIWGGKTSRERRELRT